MNVKLTLDLHVWGRLASIADTKHTTVAALIADAIDSLLMKTPTDPPPPPIPESSTAEILRLKSIGLTGRQMCAVTGMTEGQVKYALKSRKS